MCPSPTDYACLIRYQGLAIVCTGHNIPSTSILSFVKVWHHEYTTSIFSQVTSGYSPSLDIEWGRHSLLGYSYEIFVDMLLPDLPKTNRMLLWRTDEHLYNPLVHRSPVQIQPSCISNCNKDFYKSNNNKYSKWRTCWNRWTSYITWACDWHL
jgi:hypothetical protein